MSNAAVSGLILAGGAGARMGGIDKGLACWQGKPLAQHVLEQLRPQVNQIFISANRNQARYAALSPHITTIISDQAETPANDQTTEYAGPIAGIVRGLQYCSTPWLQIMPCDVPVFPANLVTQLSSAFSSSDQTKPAQIIVPEYRQQPQWACALIACTALPLLEKLFSEGARKLQNAFAEIGMDCIPIVPCDNDSLVMQEQYFVNFNKSEQLRDLDPAQIL